MNDELEKNWTLLEERYSDPIELIHKQIDYLRTLVFLTPAPVLDKSKDLIKRAEKLGHNGTIARAKGSLGTAYYVISNYDKGLPLLHEALCLLDEEDHDSIEIELHGTIALTHISLGNFQLAIEHGNRTLELIRKVGNHVQEAWTLHGFGLCYHEMGLEEEALTNFHNSLKIFKEENELNGIARALTNIGSIYSERGNLNEALEMHQECLTLFRQTDNKSGEARSLNDIGGIYLRLGELDKAKTYLEESLQIRTAMGFKQARSSNMILLGDLAKAQHNSAEAIDYYQAALEIATEVKAKKRIFEIHKLLADLYHEMEDYQEANTHLRAYYEHRHSIFNEQVTTRINSIKTAFKLEQAQKEADFAQQKNVELQDKNRELKRLLTELKATQSKLLHAEKLASLGQLTAGIAHEIKNPLNFVNNFAALSADILDDLKVVFEERSNDRVEDVMGDVQDLIEDLYFNAGKINEHGQRADRIIQSMLEHARGKKDHQQATDVNRVLIEYVKLAYHGMRASNSGFYVSFEEAYDEELPIIQANPHDLGRVFLNIMNNAFYAMKEKAKHAENGYKPTLTITTDHRGDYILVSIGDNGSGIPDNIRNDIFNPFFTTKPSGMGTGLGLSLSYEIVNTKHGGDLILAQSTPDGTTFNVKLPVTPHHEPPTPSSD